MQRASGQRRGNHETESGNGPAVNGTSPIVSSTNKDNHGVPVRIKECVTPVSLQWLAVGLAIASKEFRDSVDIMAFSGDQREVIRLLKTKHWSEQGQRAMRQCGVHLYEGEKLIESVTATLSEDALCRFDAASALQARMKRKSAK